MKAFDICFISDSNPKVGYRFSEVDLAAESQSHTQSVPECPTTSLSRLEDSIIVSHWLERRDLDGEAILAHGFVEALNRELG